MLKKLLSAFLMIAVLSVPLAALGETVRLEPLHQYVPKITPVTGFGQVIMTEKQTGLCGVFSTDGEQLTPYLFPTLEKVNYGFFSGTDDEKGINNRALVHISGAVLTDQTYGAFVAYNQHWTAAYVLSEATKKQYEYKRGKQFFNIDRCDLYFFSDEPAPCQPVGSLSHDEFSSASVHGNFIAIKDQNGKITLYDNEFKAYDYPMEKTNSPVYGINEYTVVNLATGEAAADGFIAVKEQNRPDGLWLIGIRYNFKGDKVSFVTDAAGNEILQADYAISSISGDYALVTQNKLKGLYSLESGKLIVPCKFNNIMTSSVSTDAYVHNGYAAVENGNLRGYVDTRTGEISCEIKYDRKAVTTIGCSTFWKVEDGVYKLVAADGVETEVHVDSIYEKTRGNGYLLVAQKDKLYGVIDWHGNEILPFEHNKIITITDDSRAIIRTGTGMQIDRIIIEK